MTEDSAFRYVTLAAFILTCIVGCRGEDAGVPVAPEGSTIIEPKDAMLEKAQLIIQEVRKGDIRMLWDMLLPQLRNSTTYSTFEDSLGKRYKGVGEPQQVLVNDFTLNDFRNEIKERHWGDAITQLTFEGGARYSVYFHEQATPLCFVLCKLSGELRIVSM